MALSRQAFLLLVTLMLNSPALAQEEAPQAIDLLANAREAYDPPPEVERCEAEQDAAAIRGEIVVCRRVSDGAEHRLRSPSDARSRYAAATMNAGEPRAPDLGPPPCVASLLSFCSATGPRGPAVYMIDFSTLPDVPPGSATEQPAKERELAGANPSATDPAAADGDP